ncbi:MAG: four-carbon acid sugar kinase family protein [Betaproteobacteria bacterium]|nr:four-carbon acid sugar kinase family protein [Betaproteobacteria bacterium]NBS48004.1 four-carbon acid sugar kinase family protein [Betaproteobacteria bacterium]
MTLRLAFYGDDFTGSTDAMEALALAGLNTALFLAPPDAETLASIGPLDALGVAGDSRTMTPQRMDAVLPGVFAALARCGAPIVHYKVCSTFDSAPEIGSIGHAMQIARPHFRHAWIPVVGGTPALRRYCAFGHLFARSGTDDHVYRIDRHPIMKAHPVTPMHESDLVLHLGRQADLTLANLPFTLLESGVEQVDREIDAMVDEGVGAVVLDSLSERHLTEVGQLLCRHADAQQPVFVVGPSGVEYALTQWWRQCGEIGTPPSGCWERFPRASRVLAVSASASMLSAAQVDAAVESGFRPVAVDAAALLDPASGAAATARLVVELCHAIEVGASVIVHTARGPDDPRIQAAVRMLCRGDAAADRLQAQREAGQRLADALADVTREVLQRVRVQRLLLSGGDSSSRIVQRLAPKALRMVARLAPGAPLCEAVADQPWLHGLQLALKGGQMGGRDFFDSARAGRH